MIADAMILLALNTQMQMAAAAQQKELAMMILPAI